MQSLLQQKEEEEYFVSKAHQFADSERQPYRPNNLSQMIKESLSRQQSFSDKFFEGASGRAPQLTGFAAIKQPVVPPVDDRVFRGDHQNQRGEKYNGQYEARLAYQMNPKAIVANHRASGRRVQAPMGQGMIKGNSRVRPASAKYKALQRVGALDPVNSDLLIESFEKQRLDPHAMQKYRNE